MSVTTTSVADEGQGSWEELARSAGGRGAHASTEIEELRQFLNFVIDGAPYAIPVERVREIVRMRPITPIPQVTSDIRGVISLRGEIIQVVDLRMRLGLSATQTTKSTRIVVVETDDGRVAGVLVDSVREVWRVSEDAIGPPAGGESGVVEALCSRGDEFVSLIDLNRALEMHDEQ